MHERSERVKSPGTHVTECYMPLLLACPVLFRTALERGGEGCYHPVLSPGEGWDGVTLCGWDKL